VSSKTPVFDQAFIQKQRRQLTKLREELLRSMKAEEKEETQLHSQSVGDAHEAEDDAQKLAMLEVQGTLVAHDLRRLAQVERALAKIEDGTYGLSDSNGQPIPRDRLEAMPEAIDTVQNQAAR
jgi:DnaK suppressor protein